MYEMEITWTGPLARLCLSSVCKWIRIRVFGLEYCSLPVLYYHQMNVDIINSEKLPLCMAPAKPIPLPLIVLTDGIS